MARRKHRRKYAQNASCRCPAGSRPVKTCREGQVCRGRGWGCLGTGKTPKGKTRAQFVAMICDQAYVKPPRGTGKKKRPTAQQLKLPNIPSMPPPPPSPQLPLPGVQGLGGLRMSSVLLPRGSY